MSTQNHVTREELEVIRQQLKTIENGTDLKLATSNQQVKRIIDESARLSQDTVQQRLSAQATKHEQDLAALNATFQARIRELKAQIDLINIDGGAKQSIT